jgi:type II secretory pathway pseudopilin PulG
MNRPYRSTCNSRAFTLLEAIVATALMAAFLAVVGTLSSRYTNLMLFDSGKERTLNVMQVALDRIRCETRQGVNLIEPAGATVESTVTFDRIDPEAVNSRLPWPLGVGGWDPADPADLTRVRFHVVGGSLVREATQSDGTTRTEVLARGITGFQASIGTDQNLNVTVRIDEGSRFQDLSTEVFLPLR